MTDDTPQLLTVGADESARAIAWLRSTSSDPARPGVMWFSGFHSVMTSNKVSALAQWAKAEDVALTRFDYSGHGFSTGRFEDGTIGRWLEEAQTVFAQCTSGPQILVGSSMGAWIALLMTRAHLKSLTQQMPSRIVGMVLIAPAFDMTEDLILKQLPLSARVELEDAGVFLRPSRYDEEPTPITRELIEEGRNHLLGHAPFDVHCAVRIVHGIQDPDVPWQHSMRLLHMLRDPDVRLTLVKDGEHRLSRGQDITLLLRLIEGLLVGNNRVDGV